MGSYEMIATAASPREALMARLEDPATVEALDRLLDRLDVIVLAAEAADGFLRRSNVVADSVAETLAELRHAGLPVDAQRLAGKLPELTRAGLQVAELAANPAFGRLLSSGLLERLAEPKMIASLQTVLDHLDLMALGLQSVDELLRRSEEISDNVSESIAEVTKAAPKLDFEKIKEAVGQLPALMDTAIQISRSGVLDHARKLADTLNELQATGVLEHKTVAVVGELGSAAVVAHDQKEFAANAPKGVFGLLAALRDPDVRASLGFGIAFARNYGRKLRAGA
jgi:uncharacterized protein YjgD (DUF1641 family)